jgi:hypothetical protein
MIKRIFTNGNYEYVIESKEDYEKAQKRLEDGEKILDGMWLSEEPNFKRWVDEFMRIAEASLIWEIEHDLLPI